MTKLHENVCPKKYANQIFFFNLKVIKMEHFKKYQTYLVSFSYQIDGKFHEKMIVSYNLIGLYRTYRNLDVA